VWPIEDLSLNQEYLKYIEQGMREVVLAGGTAPQLNIPELKIAAKSGTAEIGIVKGRVNSLMTGYFPFDNPKYAFTVVMENGPVGTSGASEAISPVLYYIRDRKSDFLK
jgi:cell division protein FtsI/penicillin-binding protein 2